MTDPLRAALVARIMAAQDRLFDSLQHDRTQLWLDVDLTIQQLKTLLLTVRAGAITAGQISRELRVGFSTVTGLVDRLADQGLVDRGEDPRDRRATRVTPTTPAWPWSNTCTPTDANACGACSNTWPPMPWCTMNRAWPASPLPPSSCSTRPSQRPVESLTSRAFKLIADTANNQPGRSTIVPAKGTAEWKGDLPSGSGTFKAGDTISGGYTFKSRFEDGPGSNPEQLIAAAHAACFSMALSNMLAQAGTPPESIQTEATVTLRPVDGKPTIAKIALNTVGRVPGLDQAGFLKHAEAAKAGCPVSRALASVPEITLDASLAQ